MQVLWQHYRCSSLECCWFKLILLLEDLFTFGLFWAFVNIQSLSCGHQIEAGHFTIIVLSIVLCHFLHYPVTWNFKNHSIFTQLAARFFDELLTKCCDWSNGTNKCAIIIMQVRANNFSWWHMCWKIRVKKADENSKFNFCYLVMWLLFNVRWRKSIWYLRQQQCLLTHSSSDHISGINIWPRGWLLWYTFPHFL